MTDLGHGKDLKFNKTIDPSIPLGYSSTATISTVNQLTTKAYVDSTSGNLNQLQTYYIGKAGNDSNSGLNEDVPVLTIAQAITLANAQTPDSANRYKLQIIDGGVYNIGSDNLVLSSYLYLVGGAATINATTGSLDLRDQSMFVIGNITRSGSGYTIQKTTGSGDAYVTLLGDVHMNNYGLINMDNGNLHVNCKKAFTLGTTNPSFIQVIGGNLFITGDKLENTAATGFTLRAQGSGRIYAKVKNILATDKWLETADSSHAYIQADITSGTKVLGASTTYDIREGATRTRSDGINVTAASGDITETVTSPGKKKINGNLLLTGEVMGRGDIDGFVVDYSTTTAVNITLGSCEASGIFYSKSSDTSHSMTSLAAGFGRHYVYIDHSASTSPTPTFIDSTSEPAWSDSKRGWYGQGAEPASPSTEDRCIGGVLSPSTGATIMTFSMEVLSGKNISYQYPRGIMPAMATNMNPDGTWQTPNTNDGSAVTPVTATEIFFYLENTDATDRIALYAANAEFAAIETSIGNAVSVWSGYDGLGVMARVVLGSSRNVRIAGLDANDNSLSALPTGFNITR